MGRSASLKTLSYLCLPKRQPEVSQPHDFLVCENPPWTEAAAMDCGNRGLNPRSDLVAPGSPGMNS